jgi:phosphopantothenoylcysteine synthetase/decarboxylase
MRIVVTCGPSYEPIDEVRRLTNFSTGELGTRLAGRLAQSGCDVLCFRGVGSTWSGRPDGVRIGPFATNANLQSELEAIDGRDKVSAVFHTAALCDYIVKSVQTSDGSEIAAPKIPTSEGELKVTLAPAPKLIGELRRLFPTSRIIGWKFELNGNRADALFAAERQMKENHTDGCVVNGAAYGAGFGFHEPGMPIVHCADRIQLCERLDRWVHRAFPAQNSNAPL